MAGWGRQKPPAGSPLNRGHVLAPWLAEAYLLNRGAGSPADAVTPSAGLALTSATWAPGEGGPALRFAAGSYASRSATPYYAETAFVCRFRRTATTAPQSDGIAAHHTTETVASDWYLYTGVDNKIHIDVPWVAADVCVTPSAVLTDSLWHTVGFVRTGTAGAWTYKILFDGRVAATSTTASNPAGNATETSVLAELSRNAQRYLVGDIAWAYRFKGAPPLGALLSLHADPYAVVTPPRRLVSGPAEPVGVGAASLKSVTAAGTATLSASAAGAATLKRVTASGTGVLTSPAVGSPTLKSVTASGTATLTTAGTGAASLKSVLASGTGILTTPGVGAATLKSVTAAGVGTVTRVKTRAAIREAVLAALKADSDVAALVGARVYPLVVPEDGSFPAVVYTLGRVRREHDLDGPTGIAYADFTFYAVSKKATQTVAVAEAVRQLFDGFTGTLAFAGGSVAVLETVSDDENDAWDDANDGTDRGVIATPVRYRFHYREPRPAALS